MKPVSQPIDRMELVLKMLKLDVVDSTLPKLAKDAMLTPEAPLKKLKKESHEKTPTVDNSDPKLITDDAE